MQSIKSAKNSFSKLVKCDDGLRVAYQYLRDYLVLIPGENPSQMSLCGTNVFMIGHKNTNERIMIDAGDLTAKNQVFLNNINQYLDDIKQERQTNNKQQDVQDVFVSKILITHAHHDHMGGLIDVMKLLEDRGQSIVPKVYKHLNNNQFEQEIFNQFPELKCYNEEQKESEKYAIRDITDGDSYAFQHENDLQNHNESIDLSAIYTPGHISDHMSFMLKHKGNDNQVPESILFSGDIILGSPSTVVENLSDYMDSLNKLRNTPEYRCDHICVPHSTHIDPEDTSLVMMDGEEKLNEYIKYRTDRLLQLEKITETVCSKSYNGLVSRQQLYDGLYGDRGLEGFLIIAAFNNLDLQIQYLIDKGKMTKDTSASSNEEQMYRYQQSQKL